MLQLATPKQTLITTVMSNIVVVTQPDQSVSAEVAVDQAFNVFETHYPTWTESLFDQHFVNQQVKPLVKRNWQRGRTISAIDIAMLWDAQFSNQSYERRRQNLADLTQAAKTFVKELNMRLK